ncbi:putative methyltransferase-domain-containing protein [Myxozyma melibiosi]|uniref:Protein-lysine N-methyltransferase EFM6 n=1 Tax=Myxozyma melibiosi TaxID=54550 RepID=A0ABR1F7H1_9ASCO
MSTEMLNSDSSASLPELVSSDAVATPNEDELTEDPFLQMLAETADLVPALNHTTKFAGKEYATSASGVMEAEFSGVPVKIAIDGGASGCGGKVWPAGELLSRYVIDAKDDESSLAHGPVWEQSRERKVQIVELGSGTGLVGLALANAYKTKFGKTESDAGLDIVISDQINMMDLMTENIKLNNQEDIVTADVIDWGKPLDEKYVNVSVVLAADCVYFEPAFPLLEKTLLDLAGENTLMLMAYKKRRKADNKFFMSIKKSFKIIEIKNYGDYYQEFSRDSVVIYQLVRKQPPR